MLDFPGFPNAACKVQVFYLHLACPLPGSPVDPATSKGATFQEARLMLRLPKWFVVVLALAFLVGLAAPALALETQGKIKSVTADKDRFVVTDDNGKDWTFQLDKDAKVQLGDKDIKLADLKEGKKVKIKYEQRDGKLMAQEVRCEKE
jgi:cold shock CspA family protein